MAKKQLTLKQFQTDNPYTKGLETTEDIELFLESRKYDRVWIFKLDNAHWKHLTKLLDITPDDQPEEHLYYFYFQGAQGYFNAFQTKIGWDIWLWIDPEEYKVNDTLKEMLEQSSFVWGKQGLHTGLDSNYGGTFDGPRRQAASLIIYG